MRDLDLRLSLPGVSLAFHDSGGPGRAIVFLHGAGADHATFLDQAQALREAGHRVVLLDLRGHGRSQPNRLGLHADLLVSDIEAFIDACDLDQPVLVGHSLGGNIAQTLVRRAPGSYSGLVVMGATGNTGPLTPTERRLLKFAAPALSLIPTPYLPRMLARASARSDFGRRDAERAFSQVTKAGFIEIWKATTEFVAPEPRFHIPVPLALIRGEKDRTGNIATAMPAWAEHEGVPERVVAGAGHFVSLDEPEIVTEELIRFLESLPR